MSAPRSLALLATLALPLAALSTPAAHAKVDVTLDVESLNEILPAMAPRQVSVPLAQGRGVTLLLQDLRVRGFDPTAGEDKEGFLLTSLRLVVPELGIDAPVEPQLSLRVGERQGRKHAYLKFEKVPIALPLTGSVDIGPLLPTLPLLVDTSWSVATAGGNVHVRAILREARMGARNLRLTFDLEAAP